MNINKMVEVHHRAETRTLYSFKTTNKKGEHLDVELTYIYFNNKSPFEMSRLWKKWGYTKTLLNSYISVSVDATDAKGVCRGLYNPTEKPSDDGKRRVMNFDWIFEVSDENRDKLLKECYRRFINA